MPIKVFFIGNSIAADDGIAPYIYRGIKDHPLLKGMALYEMGVIGFDMLSYVENDDHIVIVDAIISDDEEGSVHLVKQSQLSSHHRLVSQHDFGVEETVSVMHSLFPGINDITIIGITVKNIKAFNVGLSQSLQNKTKQIGNDVLKHLLALKDHA